MAVTGYSLIFVLRHYSPAEFRLRQVNRRIDYLAALDTARTEGARESLEVQRGRCTEEGRQRVLLLPIRDATTIFYDVVVLAQRERFTSSSSSSSL